MTQFQVQQEIKEEYKEYRLVNTESGEFVSIVPQWGGILNGWQVRTDQGLSNIIQGYEDHSNWKQMVSKDFLSAKLFPYPNRIGKGKYSFQGVDYQLDINFPHEGNSIHGFLGKADFSVLEEAQSSIYASLLLTYVYDGHITGYPFPFKLKVLYSYDHQNQLSITTLVKNTGTSPMPYGDGWHPYISVPHSINSCYLQFQPQAQLGKDDHGLPDGKVAGFDYFSSFQIIDDFELDDCFVLSQDPARQSIILQDPKRNLEISFELETGPEQYNYLQIYTPANRQSIAIEPMSVPPNAFNSPNDCLVLAPGAQKSLNYRIGVSEMF